MIQSKYINWITAVAVIIALIAALLLINLSNAETVNSGTVQLYETKLFGGDIIDIDIIVDQSEWESMLENAMAEEYIMVDVVINGTKFQNVGIRPKGNSSLTQVARDSTTDRFSFRLKFDEYIKGQTCFGLDTFVVNNMLGDNSYMKEYLSYDIFNYIGVDTPLYDFANISVNGEPWGLYLAIEAYDDSYLSRVYGDAAGNLYNVKSMEMGNNDGNRMPNNGQMPNIPDGMPSPRNAAGQPPINGGMQPSDDGGMQAPGDGSKESTENEGMMPPNNGMGQPSGNGGMQPSANGGVQPPDNNAGQQSGNDVRLPQDNGSRDMQIRNGRWGQNQQHSDDANTQGNQAMPNQSMPNMRSEAQNGNIGRFGRGGMGGRGSSGGDLKYTDDNESSYSSIFNNAIGKTTSADHQRVIKALKNLSTGTELETYFDVDKILRYMAAHTVVVNLDSYSSNMAQNYYIYEKNGKITILPWDYNFSFGGFQSGSASDVVNFPIDTPVSGVSLEDRPLFAKLLENEEYKARYHEYLNEIVNGYFSDGKWADKIEQLDNLIAGYVEKDPTAFCTYEEYKKALPALTKLGELRAESILGQLKGTIPSTTEGQRANPSALVSADGLNLSDLGNGMGGRGRGMMGGPNRAGNANGQGAPAGFFGDNSVMPDMATMQKAMEIIRGADGGNLTEEQKAQLTELGLTDEQIAFLQDMGSRFRQGMPGIRNGWTPDGGGGIQSNAAGDIMQYGKNSIAVISGLFALLITAIVFASKYRRSY
ncbi:CotH kinase family protein [Pseudoclostridium thermosuccinogenes]|uniref:CotH kinase family protein n=1 Tax=Clostridium thermosuccinogenes TaxID=84032 RepID=UPI002FD926EE